MKENEYKINGYHKGNGIYMTLKSSINHSEKYFSSKTKKHDRTDDQEQIMK